MVQAPFSSRSAPASASPPLSLAEISAAVAAGLVPLPPEGAGYLLLGLADQLARAPLPLDERAVLLSAEGNVSLLALTTTSRRANADEGQIEAQLRGLLGRLLSHAPGKAPALAALAQRSARGSLGPFIAELEAALIPVNRSAGRRALARLQREVERERHRLPALASATSRVARPARAPSSPPLPPARPTTARPAPPARPAAVGPPVLSGRAPGLLERAPALTEQAAVPSSADEQLAPFIPSLLPPDTALHALALPALTGSLDRTEPHALVMELPLSPVTGRAPVTEEPAGNDPTELRAPAVEMIDLPRASSPPARPEWDVEVRAEACPPRPPLALPGGERFDLTGPAETTLAEPLAQMAPVVPSPDPVEVEPLATELIAASFSPEVASPGTASPGTASPLASWVISSVPSLLVPSPVVAASAAPSPVVFSPATPSPVVAFPADASSLVSSPVVASSQASSSEENPAGSSSVVASPETSSVVASPGASSAVAPVAGVASTDAVSWAPGVIESSGVVSPSLPVVVSPGRGAAGVQRGLRLGALGVSEPDPSASPLMVAVGDLRPASVEQLLERFAPSDGLSEREVSRQLKQAVGVELSALPPGVETLLPPAAVTEVVHGPAPRVEQAMRQMPSFEPRPPRRPRMTLALLTVLVLLGLAATLALWVRAPGFFLGH